ncbi:MAG: hypothetical protein E6730_08410 [Enterococcus casseliflavus]|nr:hypothetical protein [Enterococcus casseliflavus]MDU5814371.1 hypothetical protein [Enterococcus casseliflavus]
MMLKFVLLLIGVPLIALSFVITIAILKAGWNIISKKEPPDHSSTESSSRHGGK